MNKRQLLQALSLWLLTSKLGLLNPVLAAAPPAQFGVMLNTVVAALQSL